MSLPLDSRTENRLIQSPIYSKTASQIILNEEYKLHVPLFTGEDKLEEGGLAVLKGIESQCLDCSTLEVAEEVY